VELKLIDVEDPLPDVKEGRADLALVVRADGTGPEGIRLVRLLDDPYRVVLPRGHRLAGRRLLELAELADEAWVGSEWPGPCLDAQLDACAAAGFRPSFAVQSEDYATAQGFVAAGLGVSLVPRLGLGSRHPGVVVRKVRAPEPVRVLHAAVREAGPGAAERPALRGLLDALRGAAHPDR
jgi:DNA-binding transcriptional LysR family regulator